MQYMVQLFGSATRWDEEIAAYSPAQFQAMVDHMEALNEELTASGELVEARGLGGPALVTTVRAKDDGPPQVTDGLHDERANLLAGYWVVEVADRDRAVEIAARASAAPGPGDAHNFPVEVHELPTDLPR
ncbi:YciI family protein [Streptomyces sp. 796.1]|uniref:YciI family protein n=1 Tax=Streptomyces sp. 796.1 TaxID=3163029 RepID=UPI0039C9674B